MRKPQHEMLLTLCVGTGLQLAMTLITASLLEVVLGNQILGVMPLIYGVYAGVNGYFSSQIYLVFNGTNWVKLTALSALAFPTFTFLSL